MNEIRENLIERALEEHKRIYPCSNRADFSECFTVSDNRVLFWFNTEDQSTHLIAQEI